MTKTPDGGFAASQLATLNPDECWARLEAGHVGRVVFVDGDRPVALPVNYCVFDRDIIFRTAASSSVLASYYAGHVSFQIDDIDEHQRVGWSVLASGRVQRADGQTEVRALQAIGVDPWVEGPRTLYLRLVVRRITGRRLVLTDGGTR